MNALDSPLEALALNYLIYGFLTALNNIWAWLAVVTAAVSFWSIRAFSSPPPPTVELCRRTMQEFATSTATTSSPPPNELDKVVAELLYAKAEDYSCTKTKFSSYYTNNDCFVEDNDDGGESEDEGGGATVVDGKRCDDWERMMVVRMGDMGWYRWQDTAALDGSVVRLWEGSRRRCAAAVVVDGGGLW